ncbi:Glycosyl transferase, family 2 [Alloactinosynnema sp. L-07]|uniref:glycosyltransferase family 2 protein n=1 Tax=Alloactinosynnema sp. L-07 TaxID=1653480 RepID=UPI00065F00EC|nr:glycosyltransferase family 2 protein [Alloactinosynnema sp. L-07]CRK59725.1 Glycosyl transferase, family 2 [Alloactinosynnema sp. L-07]
MPPRSHQALGRGAPVLRTAPVLAVLVCHDGAQWLRLALSALRHSSPRPRHIIAVDTGSTDDTAAMLAAAAKGTDRVLDGVITLERHTGFSEAVHAAVDHAVQRWGDPGGWIWVLHDDSAPEPDCLATLLLAAEVSPSAGVLGPLAVDWTDPREVVEAGLSTDASGHRQTGIGPSELDWSRPATDAHRFEQSSEVLAVSSAGMLIRRDLWEELGGFDRALPMLREDVDFGWRVNRSGRVVLCVPAARIRHARALARDLRGIDARSPLGMLPRAVDRAHGLRTFLVNCSTLSFLIGVPRLTLLCLLRALGFAMQRRLPESGAELRAVGYLLSGRARLREGRATRAATARKGSVRGLFTSRLTRLRNATRGVLSTMVRRRVEADAALGRLPGPDAVWTAPEAASAPRATLGPDALPAGAHGRPRRAGLRRPSGAVAVPLLVPDDAPTGLRPSPRPRPSPTPRDGTAEPAPDLVLVHVDRGRVLRQLALSPPLLLVLGLIGLAVVVNSGRWGFDLTGGRLLPVGDLGETWSDYLATWHGVAGGTSAPAPAALAIVGALGTVFPPIGGPPAAVAFLFLADLPLAGLAAYAATRRAPVRRWVRALLALGYALLPPATAAVAQGRLDVVVVHILLPLVAAGAAALLVRGRTGSGGSSWLSTAGGTALGLAVVGAFAPLIHLVIVVVSLVGFVLVPGGGARRGAALFLVVLMPLALLLPWPAVVIQHPSVVLHGVGALVSAPMASVADLLSLHPGGPGAWPFVGGAVLLAVLVGLALRPSRAVLPGLGFTVVGLLAVGLVHAVPMTPLGGVESTHGWLGAPMLVVGWGLLWTMLGVCRTGRDAAPVRFARPMAAMAVLVLIGLAASAAVAGRQGPLRADDQPVLANTLVEELAATGRSVLFCAADGAPARQIMSRPPRFGDDDIAPTPAAPVRLSALGRDLASGDPDATRAAIANAAANGVLFAVLPDKPSGDRLKAVAGELVADAPTTSDGRPVVRLQLSAGSAALLSPDLARAAVTGGMPPAQLDLGGGVVPVSAGPPNVAVRVSDGAQGRLLVIAAEEEPGWQATVDGKQAPIVRAWGHLVAVAVPTRAADVRVEMPTALRSVLLLTQGAVVLFILLTSIPGRREQEI